LFHRCKHLFDQKSSHTNFRFGIKLVHKISEAHNEKSRAKLFLLGRPIPEIGTFAQKPALSAICCIVAFYLRFTLDRSQSKIIQRMKLILYRYNQLFLILLAMISIFGYSYAMYHLWILIFFVFVHAAVIFFVPLHQD